MNIDKAMQEHKCTQNENEIKRERKKERERILHIGVQINQEFIIQTNKNIS